ncbi:pentapeptide repeat-containing protein [Streptomyces sp. NPDC057539]|uniref:pentapeptide repeat-containing protein n=1 Tax=Streptomyces sp. NPDC057539 TaxID=3346159 RepID=UPI0036807539
MLVHRARRSISPDGRFRWLRPRIVLPGALIAVIAVVLGLLWCEPVLHVLLPMADDSWSSLPSGDRAQAIGQWRLFLIQGIAALGAAVALLYTARNYRLTRRGQVTDRFTKALERIGHTEEYVRNGGVLAMEQVLKDDAGHASDAALVLTSLVRQRTAASAVKKASPRMPRATKYLRQPLPDPPQTDVQLALAVLGRNPTKGINLSGRCLVRADLQKADLRGADLRAADLRGANLRGADLREAKLAGACLRHADLRGAKLDGCDGEGADLVEAMMWKCSLVDAGLDGADLTGADLAWADLSEARLGDALLTAADLHEAKLIKADLRQAWLPAAHLGEADLTGAKLQDAHLTAESWGGRRLLSAWGAADRINRKPSPTLTPAIRASAVLHDEQRLDAHFAASVRATRGLWNEEESAQRGRLLVAARARLYQACFPRPAPRKITRTQQRKWYVHHPESFGRTNLTGAVLSNAELSGVDLAGADLTHAVLKQCDLSGVKSLTVEQVQAALVDPTTVLPSSWQSPRRVAALSRPGSGGRTQGPRS